jgi:hypothetical protein
MLTGIGAPTAWPFFKRGGLPVRTALGAYVGASVGSLASGPRNIVAGDLILVGTASDNRLSATDVEVDIDGNVFGQDVLRNSGDLKVTINSYYSAVAIVGGIITATWTPNDPNNLAIVIVTVSNLGGVMRESKSSAATTANPDSGITAAYAAVKNFHFGVIGTLGKGSDALGTWQNGMVAGQRIGSVGTPGIDIKEGYQIPPAPIGARAKILGQTSRPTIAMIAYYE